MTNDNVWKPHLTVAAVIVRDGRYLFVREHADGRLVINQPAGHVEDGESIAAAVIRETREETGLRFRPHAIVGIYRWRRPDNGTTFLRVCFAGGASEPETPQPLDADIVDTVWLTPRELTACADLHRSPLVARVVRDHLAGRHYPLGVLQDVEDL